MVNFKNLHFPILTLVLIGGILIRTQNFYLPPIDAHPMRQTDTECVAYNFAIRDGNLLHPQACLIRPVANPQGYFFLEFPLYQYGISLLYRILGHQIAVVRLYNLGLYLTAGLALYYFVLKLQSRQLALFSVFLFSFAPGSIFFIGHAIHPDVFATATMLISLALYMAAAQRSNHWLFFISVLFLSFSIATRPFGLIILPAYLYLLNHHKAKRWQYLVATLSSITLYGLWKLYQFQYPPELSAWENWVLTGQQLLRDPQVLIQQLILKNVVGEVIGKVITLFFAAGVVVRLIKRTPLGNFCFLWLLLVPVYWYIAPNGNIIHQYYANVFLIPILILSAYGISHITNFIINKKLRYVTLVFILALIAYNGYRTSSYYFNDLHPVDYLHIASKIKDHIPQDKKIIYLGKLNSVPFSLAHRQGWMLGYSGGVDIEPTAQAVMAMNSYADYIVAAHNNTDLSPQDLAKLSQNSTIVFDDDSVTIYKFN